MKYYKILNSGKSCYGGNADWSLPIKNKDGTWTPGEWMPEIIGELVPCKNGYHLCRLQDLIHWLNKEIYEAEFANEVIEDEDKIVVRQCRLLRKVESWNDKTARLFACWCVRQIWHLLKDERSKNAIEVAEKFANGKATQEELEAAAKAATKAVEDSTLDEIKAAWIARDIANEDVFWAIHDAAWMARCALVTKAALETTDKNIMWNVAITAEVAGFVAGFVDGALKTAWTAAEEKQTKKLLEMIGE